MSTQLEPAVTLVLKAAASSFRACDLLDLPPSILFTTANKVKGHLGRKWKFKRKLDFARATLIATAKFMEVDELGIAELLALGTDA